MIAALNVRMRAFSSDLFTCPMTIGPAPNSMMVLMSSLCFTAVMTDSHALKSPGDAPLPVTGLSATAEHRTSWHPCRCCLAVACGVREACGCTRNAVCRGRCPWQGNTASGRWAAMGAAIFAQCACKLALPMNFRRITGHTGRTAAYSYIVKGVQVH